MYSFYHFLLIGAETDVTNMKLLNSYTLVQKFWKLYCMILLCAVEN